MQGKYLYSSDEEFNMPRRELLLDKYTGWATMDLKVQPDQKLEERMRKRSDGKNRIVVHVLTEREDGAMAWSNFMIVDAESFEKDSELVTPEMVRAIRGKMNSLDKSHMGISRVRIVRYGHYIDEKEVSLAERRADNIYKEMRLYKLELERLEAEKIEKAEADRLRKEAEARELQRIKEEQAEQRKKEEAEKRRKQSIASFKLKAATFQTGLALLSREAYDNISIIAREIMSKQYKMVTVEGHTDSTGNEEKNLKLSEDRAIAVYTELIMQGIPQDKLRIAYFGSSMPVDSNLTPEGRAANRRVEIFVE
jgi:outer membrane protein OmpA-like peptidoglycan-associated protein